MPPMQGQLVPASGSDTNSYKAFWYEGTDKLYPGYALCRNADYGTAASADFNRGTRVEKPASGNLHNFVGVVAPGRPDGIQGPALVNVIVPDSCGVMTNVYTNASCTIDATILCVVADSYILQGLGKGMPVARAHQTIDRSATGGLCVANLVGVNRSQALVTRTAAGAGPSPAIWESCPEDLMDLDPTIGFKFFDDFVGCPTMASATAQGPYITYQDTGVTIAPLETSDEVGGIIEVANNDADEDEGSIALGASAVANFFKIASGKPLWMEARLKLASVANSNLVIAIGLGEEGVAAADILTDATGALADKDFIGWYSLAADGDAIIGGHNTAGGGGITAITGAAEAIAADTYFKVGLYFDGTTLYWFFNGVSQGSAAMTATNVPDGEELTLFLATKTTAAAEAAVQMDWWKVAQLR